jgi:CBS domain-containing protein/gamma-glutamylcysteine synthetase
MEDTRGHKKVEGELLGEARRRFTRAVLRDLQALERMLDARTLETGVPRIGAEQELFLVDSSFGPAPGALRVLDRLDDPHFTTELALFQLEMNADPQSFGGDGLSRMEQQLSTLLERVRAAGAEVGVLPVLVGILPTIEKNDLGLDNMVPSPRYQALNRAMTAARGESYDIAIKGLDELNVKHDSVMVEACNASFQVHLQVDPDDFARLYNVSQLCAAPVLAAGTNSPLLFGRRLWNETRIALFQQAVDTRPPGHHLRESSARVSSGRRWAQGSVLELFKEDVARFRPLVGTDLDEDPLATLAAGGVPQLKALRLHNGTIYRWNRPCYGVHEGKPHLRIELRVLPSGPTLVDEIANAALWLGLMSEIGGTGEDPGAHLDFEHTHANLDAAAREGLGAHFTWMDGRDVAARPLIVERLLPMAEAGLRRAGIVEADVKKYLGIVDRRVRSERTGSRWMLTSLSEMKERGTPGARLNVLVAATVARQKTGRAVHEWERARFDEMPSARSSYHKVSQYMTTDIFTVHADDPVELAANLMGWERIRHLPVEDGQGRLLGLVSYRAVLRYFTARAGAAGDAASTPVSDIMRTDVVTATPETTTLEAIGLLKRFRIGCLPVVQDGHLVAILTEEDFLHIAADLLERKLGE